MKDKAVLLLRYLIHRDRNAYEMPEEIRKKGNTHAARKTAVRVKQKNKQTKGGEHHETKNNTHLTES